MIEHFCFSYNCNVTMQTGVISFCDRINYNIKSLETKDEILHDLQRLFNIQILQRHWFHFDDKCYEQMIHNQHLACLRSNGNPYYMYFTKYEDVPIIYFIDKKIHPGYQKPRIMLGRGLWDPVLFTNTLLDGEMVKDTYNGWVFLINDIIAYKGKYLQHEPLPKRLEYAIEMIDTCLTPDPIIDCCRYQVKQYYYPTQEGIQSLIETSKILPYTSRGMYFVPFTLKYKPKLVNFDESLIKSVIRKVKDVPDFQDGTTIAAMSTTNEPIKVAEEMHFPVISTENNYVEDAYMLRKTELPDIYEVYEINKHTQLRGGKLGTAVVPNMKVSKMMRAIFKDTTVATYIKITCEYKKEINKWLPLGLVA